MRENSGLWASQGALSAPPEAACNTNLPQREAAGGIDERAREGELSVEEAVGVGLVPLALLPVLEDVDLFGLCVDARESDRLCGEGAPDGEQFCERLFVIEVREQAQRPLCAPVTDLHAPSLAWFYEVFTF